MNEAVPPNPQPRARFGAGLAKREAIMQKQYYDHKTKLCEKCLHFVPAGERTSGGAQSLTWWPDACHLYGYLLTGKYPELADNCDGFQTPAEHQVERQRKELEQKLKKRTRKKQL